MTSSRISVYAALLAIILLLGVGYCREREARKRATHDATADSLARNTQDATRESQRADSVSRETLVEFRDRWRTVHTIDTLRIPIEARDALRACERAVTALETSCARKDTLITALRRELFHALHPPPGKRMGYFAEGGYDLLDRGAVVGLGATIRLAGPVSLLGKVEGASQVSAQRDKPQMRAVAGLRVTF